MSIVVGVAGKIGSGKSTVADYLVREYGFVEMAFADSLKTLAYEWFGVSRDVLWGASDRRSGEVRNLLQQLGTEVARGYQDDIWIRHLSSRIDNFLKEGVDYLNTVKVPEEIEKCPGIVVSDVRFVNEAQWLTQPKFMTYHWGDARYKRSCKVDDSRLIHVFRDEEQAHVTKKFANHASETGVDKIDRAMISLKINNSGTLKELYGQLDQFMGALLDARRENSKAGQG